MHSSASDAKKQLMQENSEMKLFTKKTGKNGIFTIILITIIASFFPYYVYDKYFSRKMMPATIEPYNFTDIGVGDFYVNGTWGGNSDPHTGGGSSVCCALIPEKWRPGLVVNIKWIRSDLSPRQYSFQAEVPPYTESGALQVLFMENDTVKVYVNDYWPCTPMHPMPKTKKLCPGEKKQ